MVRLGKCIYFQGYVDISQSPWHFKTVYNYHVLQVLNKHQIGIGRLGFQLVLLIAAVSADDVTYFPSMSVRSRGKKVVTLQSAAQCVLKVVASRWRLCTSKWCGRLIPVLLLVTVQS